MSTNAEDNANTMPHVEGQVGRKEKHHLTTEERREVRARIAQWLYTPGPFREPSTLKELAQDLDISYSYARYLKDKIPNNLQDYIAQCESVAVAQYADVCKTLANRAKAGDQHAAKLIASEMVKPLKSLAVAEKSTPPPEMPEHVKRAFEYFGSPKVRRERERLAAEKQALEEGKPSTPTTAPLQQYAPGLPPAPQRESAPTPEPDQESAPQSANPATTPAWHRNTSELGPAFERRLHDDVPTRINSRFKG